MGAVYVGVGVLDVVGFSKITISPPVVVVAGCVITPFRPPEVGSTGVGTRCGVVEAGVDVEFLLDPPIETVAEANWLIALGMNLNRVILRNTKRPIQIATSKTRMTVFNIFIVFVLYRILYVLSTP